MAYDAAAILATWALRCVLGVSEVEQHTALRERDASHVQRWNESIPSYVHGVVHKLFGEIVAAFPDQPTINLLLTDEFMVFADASFAPTTTYVYNDDTCDQVSLVDAVAVRQLMHAHPDVLRSLQDMDAATLLCLEFDTPSEGIVCVTLPTCSDDANFVREGVV